MDKLSWLRREDGTLVKYTSFGCYPLFYVTRRGEVLCASCASQAAGGDDPATDADVNYEQRALFCGDCGSRIESAYAEDEAL